MKLKCLVIDDDPLICDLIKHFCDKIPEIEYCISAGTGMDGLQVLSGQEINLIFLDFNLPDIKGQYLLEIKKTDVPVIMVTSEADFAAKSYEYEDVQDFLVKPISFDRFQKAVQRILTKPQRSTPVKQDQEVIFVKDGTKFVRIPYQDILYLKSEGNYVSFVTTDKTILSLFTIKELEEKLPSYFMRVHRSYIVNLERMESISTEEIGIGKHHIPISQKYRPDLMEYIGNANE